MKIKYMTIAGVRIDNVDYRDAYAFINTSIENKDPRHIVSLNVDGLVQATKNDQLRRIVNTSDLVLVDSRILLFSSYLLKRPLKGIVPGSSFLPRFARYAAGRGYRIFLLGALPGVANRARAALEKANPAIKIVGTYSPPFGFEDDERENRTIITMIKSCAPDVLFVGLGVPKQEVWIDKYKRECAVPVSIGVGAAFDFLAGTVRRAPRWMQQCGLEWLWRLCQEPRRLWKRYLVDDVRFIGILLSALVARKKRQ